LESDVLSLDFASLLCRFSDFGREIASGILAFGIPTILEAAKSCFGRDVAEAWFDSNLNFIFECYFKYKRLF